MKITWKYLNEGSATRKHAFMDTSKPVSMCGRIPIWYGAKWLYDEVGLKSRRECKHCCYVIKVKEGNTQLAR